MLFFLVPLFLALNVSPSHALTSRAVCSAVCDQRVSVCVALGGVLRACRKQTLDLCHTYGVSVCATATTTTTRPTTTTTRVSTTTTTSTRPSTTTTRASTTTTRASTTSTTSTVTTRPPTTTTTTLPGPQLTWVRRIGNGLIDSGSAVAVDAGGNRILAGVVSGSVDFGAGLVNGYESDGFVAKYTPTGALLWARRFGSAGIERVVGVGVDTAARIVVAGTFAGTVDFGTGPLTSVTTVDTFVAVYGPNGLPLYAGRLAAAAYALAVRPDGTFILTGTAVGAVDFGAGAVAAISARDMFVAQYAASGALLWVRRMASSSSITPKAVAVNASGMIAVTGYFTGTANLGGTPALTSAGGYDLFIATYSSLGTLGWARGAGGLGTDDGRAVAIDTAGNVVITGHVQGLADLGGGTLGGAVQSLAVAKYSSAGAHLWSRAYGSTFGATGNGVALTPTGSVLLSGSFQGAGVFGATILTSAGTEDIVVEALTSTGTPLWSARYGGTLADRAWAITADAAGHPVLAGSFDYFVDFGSGPILTSGNGDVFLLDLH